MRSADGRLTIATFQVTTKLTHSCDALVMQVISNGLLHQGVVLSSVTHHAVLPTAKDARKFKFMASVNMAKADMKLLSATAAETPAAAASKESAETVRTIQLRRFEICPEEFQEDVAQDLHMESAALAAENFGWTNVSVGEHLYLRDEVIAESFEFPPLKPTEEEAL